MVEFDRIVPVVNPHSSNFERAKGYLHELYDAYPQFYDESAMIFTSASRMETLQHITDGTRPGDLAVILGGDGTNGVTAEAIAGRGITALPLWAGNGNDGPRDLNGEAGSRPMKAIIEQGRAVAIHPLALTIDDAHTRLAVNYFEIGCNPKGAQLLNSELWRRLPGYRSDHVRAAYEYTVLPLVALFSRRFAMSEEEAMRKAVNFSVVNSRYMAKHAKFPTHLAEPRAFVSEVATQAGLLPWALHAVRGTLRGNYLEKGETKRLHLGRTVLAHADAEPFPIEKGSKVELALAETAFYAVTTRPAAGPDLTDTDDVKL